VYLLCPFLGIACLWDYSTGKIPNFLQFNLMSIGLIYSYGISGWRGVLAFLLKVLVVTAIMFPIFILSMIGAGDVKLIALASGYFPLNKIIWFVFYLVLCAAFIGAIKLIVNRRIRLQWSHFFMYIKEVATVGEIKPYHQTHDEQVCSSIEMSGPVLFSVLLAWGGVY